ncbi:MAG: hypothetical protein ACRDIL_11990 [Candidatus Limnocylindrales bacterium]
MQNLILGAIVFGAVLGAVALTVTFLDRRGKITPLQIGLGLGVGLVGAFIVLVTRTDLIPDGPEDGLERVFVIAVTAVAVIGTWYRIART